MSNVTIQIKPHKTILCPFNLDSCRDVYMCSAFKTKITQKHLFIVQRV